MKKCPAPVHHKLLQLTNEPWNQLQLNSPWSVGMVSQLIRQEDFTSYQNWRAYYYSSGLERAEQMQNISPSTRYVLDYLGPRSAKIMLKEEYLQYINLQHNHGRSRSILLHRSGILRNALNPKLTLNEAYQIVEYRVLGETLNGIYIREKSFENHIKRLDKSITTVHAVGQLDYQYAIDYELYRDGALICAVQVKPKSYQSDKSYVRRAKSANKIKNDMYTQEFGKPVLTILVSQAGEVILDTQYGLLLSLVD
jgi:hypothetical protein